METLVSKWTHLLYAAFFIGAGATSCRAQGFTITTVAGDGSSGYSGDGGSATSARITFPAGLAIDAASGNLYIVDTDNERIRKVTPAGIITTVAGNGIATYSGDGGPATDAALNLRALPSSGVAVDASGNLYIADSFNNRIRKVSTNGIITTVVGTGGGGYSGDGGQATSAQIGGPSGLAIDSAGNLYISCDTDFNSVVRKVSPAGVITTVAGSTPGFSGDGGLATEAQLSLPQGLAADAAGNVYIADTGNQRIRKISFNGTITTVAGNGNMGYDGDGGPATSFSLSEPDGVAVDVAANIYIADTDNYRIRRVSAGGTITTVADGNGFYGYAGDGGPAVSAEITQPDGIVVDSTGDIYIADLDSNRVRLLRVINAAVPDLTVTKTHSGNFTQGQTGATYTITAGNFGTAPTAGTVTVTDTLPAGLTAASISGTGWSCTQPSGPCTRSDALAVGSSYQPLLLTVSVAGNAPASVTNMATVSGGGSPSANASDLTAIAGGNQSLPDLVITSLTGPNTAIPGGQITANLTIANQGTAAAGAFNVEYYFSMTPSITTGAVDTNWSCKLAGLAAGTSTPCSGFVGVPSSLTPGTWFLGAIADPTNQIIESNKSNNSRVADTGPVIVGAQFNLTPTSVNVGAAATAGTVTVSATPSNATWIASSNASWLSITSGFNGTGNGAVGYSVAANTNTTSRVGTLTIGGQLFTVNQAAEPTSLPDLVITSLTGPNTAVPGGQISVSMTVANQGTAGAGAFLVEFYFSTTPTIATTGSVDSTWSCSVTGLAVGTSYTCAGPIGVPSSLTAGTWYLGAIADPTNQVMELNNSNQSRVADSGPVTIGGATFFNGETSLGSGVYYLTFPDGNLFGYYNFASSSIIYHYDLGVCPRNISVS